MGEPVPATDKVPKSRVRQAHRPAQVGCIPTDGGRPLELVRPAKRTHEIEGWTMAKTVHGKVHGKTIELDEDLGGLRQKAYPYRPRT